MSLNPETKLMLDQLKYQWQTSLGVSLFYWLLGEISSQEKNPDGDGNISTSKDLGLKITVTLQNHNEVYEAEYVNIKKGIIALQSTNTQHQASGVSIQPKVYFDTPISWKVDK